MTGITYIYLISLWGDMSMNQQTLIVMVLWCSHPGHGNSQTLEPRQANFLFLCFWIYCWGLSSLYAVHLTAKAHTLERNSPPVTSELQLIMSSVWRWNVLNNIEKESPITLSQSFGKQRSHLSSKPNSGHTTFFYDIPCLWQWLLNIWDK